ncbi:MurR/RpiR family transcriptional regulator [Streptomyces globisporus]|uniref:MurR/RpiR family transcriptional regulator n=1 Tax=Streptomyces globisporus TaxID=1908 RepID=UPI00346144A3|nr:hypothetical protein OG838_35655 [Streptomyces globisporus]
MTIEAWLAGRKGYHALGPQAGRVVDALVRAPQFATYSSAREVAERAGVNVSTVVRTAQQLGFEGWTDLRQELRAHYLDSVASGEPGPSPATDAAGRALRQDAANITALTTEENLRAIRATAEAIGPRAAPWSSVPAAEPAPPTSSATSAPSWATTSSSPSAPPPPRPSRSPGCGRATA